MQVVCDAEFIELTLQKCCNAGREDRTRLSQIMSLVRSPDR